MELEVTGLASTVQEICAAGPEVRVLEPAHMREAVVAALTAMCWAAGRRLSTAADEYV